MLIVLIFDFLHLNRLTWVRISLLVVLGVTWRLLFCLVDWCVLLPVGCDLGFCCVVFDFVGGGLGLVVARVSGFGFGGLCLGCGAFVVAWVCSLLCLCCW